MKLWHCGLRIFVIVNMLTMIAVTIAKTRPPALDPNTCPSPYDPNLCIVPAMAWLPADVNTSVISVVNVWNKKGGKVDVTLTEVVYDANNNPTTSPMDHSITTNEEYPLPDPNGGYHQSYTWGFTPRTEKIYYLLFTARTVGKNWQPDRRIILVYTEEPDIPILWVQDLPIITTQAQRLWQVAKKQGLDFTAPASVRMPSGR